MHLLDTYALRTGSKVKKPFIVKKFFPLPVDKYITIQNSSGMAAKCYDYFQEVLLYLIDKLDVQGYRIVQIGNKDDKGLAGAINLCGQTNINQTAFILNNSSLHIGNDSFAIHMASAFNVPCVGLYGITYPNIAGPYWNKENSICLTPENFKASFNPNESPKKVNSIKPEIIIEAVNNLLLKNSENINLKTKFIGPRYLNPVLEVFPDQVVPPNLLPNQMANIRLDYKNELTENDYNNIFSNLNIRPSAIITDKKFDISLFLGVRDRITQVIYNITNSIDMEFISNLFNFNINSTFVFENNGKNIDILNQRKLDLIEYPVLIQEIESINENIIKDLSKEDNLLYSSKKILFANQKMYASKHAFHKNQELGNNLKLLDIPLSKDDLINVGLELGEFFIYTK